MPEPLLKNLWTNPPAGDQLELLRYRSNLLGTDLRITNYAGGNTSSKIPMKDGNKVAVVLAVKGSGGDLGSIKREGFALLYLQKLEELKAQYRGEPYEDEMAALYSECAFPGSTAPPSIDTPLHAFLPFRHVDHLHPDWAIAMAAARNGQEKLAEFNQRFNRRVIWVRWQRPGFELGLMMRRALDEHPDCDAMLLANHGLFTWGETHEECYRSSLQTIEQMGEFVRAHENSVEAFGGPRRSIAAAADPAPRLRELITAPAMHHDTSPDVMQFVNSVQAPHLAALGTSCPDHFIRTRVAPLFIEPGHEIEIAVQSYRERYTAYYEANRSVDSPKMRSADPAVVLVPGAGMYTFSRNDREAQIVAEFYTNAIHVMRGATALGDGDPHNYVALPQREAFRIEYWSLEEAKLRRLKG